VRKASACFGYSESKVTSAFGAMPDRVASMGVSFKQRVLAMNNFETDNSEMPC